MSLFPQPLPRGFPQARAQAAVAASARRAASSIRARWFAARARGVRWFDEKSGGERSGHDWVKAHAICGAKTTSVTAPVFRVRLRNPTDTNLNLWMEPLGDQVTIPPHTAVEVHCTEQLGHATEFEVSDGGITVYGWVQSVFAVSEDGELQALWALPKDKKRFRTRWWRQVTNPPPKWRGNMEPLLWAERRLTPEPPTRASWRKSCTPDRRAAVPRTVAAGL